MAKTRSDDSGTGIKNSSLFHEKVNSILLIMFLTVAAILFLKGCGGYNPIKEQCGGETQHDEQVVASDNTLPDSLKIT